jgi:hypothetical protein
MLTVNKPKWISPQRMQRYIQFGIAQAVIDNIAQSVDNLCVRNILPSKDLLDGNGDNLRSDEWVQPASDDAGYRTADTTIDLYSTGINSRNTQKVLLLYGVKNMKYFSEPIREGELTGTQAEVDGPAELYLTSIDVMRGHVKITDIPDLSMINDIGYVFFQTPILYKRNDDMVIRGRLKKNAMGKKDNLKLQAFIVEALGAHVMG